MAILANLRVLTLDYWKVASDIVPGDILFDRNGEPVKVKVVQKYMGQDCYRVYFNDNLTIEGDQHLCLPLENERYRKQVRKYKGRFKFRRPLMITPLGKLKDLPLYWRDNEKDFSVPTAGPLKLPEQTLPVPPFIFGYWFFSRVPSGKLTLANSCAPYVERKFKDHGYAIEKKCRSEGYCYITSIKPSIVQHLAPNIPAKIPNNYLLASAEQRLELLRGIMNSKSRLYNQREDKFRFTTRSRTIALQIQYLAESLGCVTSMYEDPYLKNYAVFIKTKLRLIEEQMSRPVKVRPNWRLVKKIEPIKPQMCVHIETDGKDNSFLVGEGFIPCL